MLEGVRGRLELSPAEGELPVDGVEGMGIGKFMAIEVQTIEYDDSLSYRGEYQSADLKRKREKE